MRARSPGLRRALARVAGRLAATKGWERLGVARLGDYAVEHAGRVSVRRLCDDVERPLATGQLAPPALEASDPSGVQTGAITGSPSESARLFFVADAGVAQLFRTLLAVTQRALERERGRPCTRSEALEAMLEHALAAWQPEPPTARYRSGDVGGPISASGITS